MDPETLAMPSKWSKREDVVRRHVEITTTESLLVHESVEDQERRIPYGDDGNWEHETLDVFGTELPPGSPIFVYISGGYWIDICGDISAYPTKPLVDNDIVTIIFDYDRTPAGITLTQITEQIIKAAKWILNYAEERSCRSITFGGHSAGAQLTCMLFSSEWFQRLSEEKRSLFKGIFLYSGVFDCRPLLQISVNETLKMTPEEAELMSPNSERNLAKFITNSEFFKVFIFVAEYDSPQFKDQAKNYSKALIDGNVNTTFMTVPMVDHFDLVEKLMTPRYTLTKMLIDFIKSSI